MKITALKFNPMFSALDFAQYPPSIANLPAALTINGVTKDPTFRYKGQDANGTNWAPWGYGETLTLQAGTAPTYNNGSPLLGSVDDSVKFNAGGYYTGSNTLGNVGTNDFVLEMVIDPTVNKDPMVKKNATAGWRMSFSSAASPLFALVLTDTGGTATVNSAALTANATMHAMLFVDRSGSAQWYINGVASGSAGSVAARSLTLDQAVALAIGANSTGGDPYNDKVFCMCQWQGASWLDTHLQATVAATRFAQLNGTYPQVAKGTKLPTYTRASAAYSEKVELDGTTKLYYVGSGWPRVCSKKDSGGVTRKGYCSETSAQNICLQSQTFATTWTPARATVPTTAVVCPDGVTRTTCTLHEDNTAGNNHMINGGFNFNLTSGTTYVISVFCKAVARTWVRLSNINLSPSFDAYFDVGNGLVGTVSGATSGIINYGNGWYRCYVVLTLTSSGNEQLRIVVGEADNDVTFNGLNQDSLYIFGAQIETGNYPSSYIPTTTTAVTRAADSLYYTMNDGNMNTARGSLECNVLCPNIDQAGSPTYWYLSDNSDNNRLALLANNLIGSDDFPSMVVTAATAAQAVIAGTSDIWNNGWNKLRGIWGPNDARLLVNSVQEGTQDTVVTVPTGITKLNVGSYRSAGYELNGMLSNLRIFGEKTIKW